MRRLPSLLVFSAIAPAAVALPVLRTPQPSPHPVAPTVRTVAVTGSGGLTAHALTAPREVGEFDTVGARWAHGTLDPDAVPQVRTRSDGGTWSGWTDLEPADTGPDPGSSDARAAAAARGGTDGSAPIWVGPSNAVQVRVVPKPGAGVSAVPAPAGLSAVLVDAGSSDADAVAGTPHTVGGSVASASAARPQILTRAQWGADESLRTDRSSCVTPDYSSTVKIGFVHHTDTPNGYSAADVPKIIRSIYAYHTQSNGWCDIGYNFLVDRFGRIWEGRYGGIDKAVIGAHTGGFNTDSFAAALIGNYQSVEPPAVMRDAVARLFAWKLGRYYRDPTGTDTLVSAGGGTDKWPKGQTVRFNVVAGHRDAGNTSCPGDAAYADLPGIRAAVARYMGLSLYDPTASTTEEPVGGDPVTVTAETSAALDWTLQVADDETGRVVHTSAGSGTAIKASWDLAQPGGTPAPPGGYTLTLSGAQGSEQALPWTAHVDIDAPPLGPADPAGFVPVSPARVLDTRTGLGRPGHAAHRLGVHGELDLHVLGAAGVPADGVAAVALNVTGAGATEQTNLTVYPAGQVRPNTSSLNVAPHATAASLVIARLGLDDDVTIYNQAGTIDVVADVLGYYPSSASAGSLYHPQTPVRVLATPSTGDPLAAGESRVLPLAGRFGLPPTGATAVVLNVTAVRPSAAGYVAVRPRGGTGHTSSVNFVRGQIVPNRVVTALSPDGAVELYNPAGSTDVIVDLVGWYGDRAAGGSTYIALSPKRILDTRTGTGGFHAPLGASRTIQLPVAGRGGVPASGASAVVLTLTATRPSAAESFVSAWPGGLARPGVSDLNTVRGLTVANLVVVPLGRDGTVALFNKAGNTDLIADVLGYYAAPQ